MIDELWNRRRQMLEDQLQRAATALLEHTGAQSFCVTWGSGGQFIAGGSPESIQRLVAANSETPHS